MRDCIPFICYIYFSESVGYATDGIGCQKRNFSFSAFCGSFTCYTYFLKVVLCGKWGLKPRTEIFAFRFFMEENKKNPPRTFARDGFKIRNKKLEISYPSSFFCPRELLVDSLAVCHVKTRHDNLFDVSY